MSDHEHAWAVGGSGVPYCADCGVSVSTLTRERDEARAALKEAEEYLRYNIPQDSWGRLDRGADSDRERVLATIRRALGDVE